MAALVIKAGEGTSRHLTLEEPDRILAAVEPSPWQSRPDNKKSRDRQNAGGVETPALTSALRKRQTHKTESLRFLLRGVWLSGLRLGEARSLTRHLWADGIHVDLSPEFVQLLIGAESEKERTGPSFFGHSGRCISGA